MRDFTSIMRSTGGKAPIVHIEYIEKALINLYKYPKREYHNWGHIEVCLHELDAVNLPGIDEFKDLIAIAIYYHDCIYDPENKDNEERSAERAFMDLLALGFLPQYAQWVYDHIMLTTHKKHSVYISGQLLMDIDLSILGKDTQTFQAYEEGIRQEYNFVSEDIYNLNRVKFLRSLLEKDIIYQTEYFRDRYEKSAKENITNCINKMFFVHFAK